MEARKLAELAAHGEEERQGHVKPIVHLAIKVRLNLKLAQVYEA